MASHKLTFLGHEARKVLYTYLHGDEEFNEKIRAEVEAEIKKGKNPDKAYRLSTRRFAYANGVIAVSGRRGRELAQNVYGVDVESPRLYAAFEGMLGEFGFEGAVESRGPDACAEARLWITLAGLHGRYAAEKLPPRHRHPHPRHLDVWVYELNRKGGFKEDSPCPNCRQWVRREFRTVNGT